MDRDVTDPEAPATRLLQELRDGDPDAAEKLLPLIYGELHRIARRSFQGQSESHTLQPTALVNEAWIRLMGGRQADWQDKNHFLGVAATAMRHVLVDHARAKGRDKRGKRADVPLESLDLLMSVFEERAVDVLALHEALEKLTEFDERMARVVELRFFGGHTVPEVAEILVVSDTTVERVWRLARAWLQREMGG
jgi:RNA polymerase sigma-70 factor (ECF subfamily)